MKKFVAIAIFGLCVPGAAFAQSCQTSGPADIQKSCIAGGVPQLSGLSGVVTLVRAGKVVPVENGIQLMAGDRVIVRQGSGNLSLGGSQGGSCSLPLSAQSNISITKTALGTCATQRAMAPAGPAGQASITPPMLDPVVPAAPIAPVVSQGVSPLVLAIGGSALAGAAGIAISQSGSNSRLSP